MSALENSIKPDHTKMPSVSAVAQDLSSGLRRLGDPARARGVQQYFKHEIVALGITAPALRAFVQARTAGLRGHWRASRAIELCDRLFREPELEIRGAGILFLAGFRRELTPALLPVAKRWCRQRLDNWALVDSFCGSVLSPLFDRHPEVEHTLAVWSRAKSLWVRRAALVTLVPFARRGQRLDLVYRLAREHLADPEDLLHKALGWVLREAGKRDPPRLRRFLLRHGPAIPRTTLRYAIERFAPAERAELLQTTRQPGRVTSDE